MNGHTEVLLNPFLLPRSLPSNLVNLEPLRLSRIELLAASILSLALGQVREHRACIVRPVPRIPSSPININVVAGLDIDRFVCEQLLGVWGSAAAQVLVVRAFEGRDVVDLASSRSEGFRVRGVLRKWGVVDSYSANEAMRGRLRRKEQKQKRQSDGERG